jgi:hypothetical protein
MQARLRSLRSYRKSSQPQHCSHSTANPITHRLHVNSLPDKPQLKSAQTRFLKKPRQCSCTATRTDYRSSPYESPAFSPTHWQSPVWELQQHASLRCGSDSETIAQLQHSPCTGSRVKVYRTGTRNRSQQHHCTTHKQALVLASNAVQIQRHLQQPADRRSRASKSRSNSTHIRSQQEHHTRFGTEPASKSGSPAGRQPPRKLTLHSRRQPADPARPGAHVF